MKRPMCLALVGLLLGDAGCWRTVALKDVEVDADGELGSYAVRLTLPHDHGQVRTITLKLHRIAYPMVQGHVLDDEVLLDPTPEEQERATRSGTWARRRYRPGGLKGQDYTADLREVGEIEVRSGAGRVLLYVVGITGAVVTAAALIAVAAGACPFLHIDRGNGMELAGVPYAGAVWEALQRDDLLPLDPLPTGRVKMQVTNGGRYEIDHNDRLELLLVDHAPSLRALTTLDAQVVLVGESRPPLAVHDLRGRDRTSSVLAEDRSAWESDLDDEASEADPVLRDGLVVELPQIESGAPVLEIVAANTPWLDLVFAHVLCLFGDRLREFAATDEARAVREDHGAELRIEVPIGGAWHVYASVPTPGMARRIAVLLPPGGRRRVRLSAGVGFWRIDQLAVSSRSDAPAVLRHVPAAMATDDRGRDVRDLVAASDGRYQELPDTGATVALQFDVPPVEAGRARTAFFSSSGYYTYLRGIEPHWSPATLLGIARDSDGLGRYGIELYREYRKLVAR